MKYKIIVKELILNEGKQKVGIQWNCLGDLVGKYPKPN
jgi:hypothetical protein